MEKKHWNRIGFAAAAIACAAVTAGVTSRSALASDAVDRASGRLSAASARIANSDVAVNMRYQFAPTGTDYFGPDDVVEGPADTDGFSWG